MAHTGVPLPFMAGLRYLFDKASVVVQPGRVEVLADVQYVGAPLSTEALLRGPGAVDVYRARR